jgi:drug/metabolite transporter (DMT)-like permease
MKNQPADRSTSWLQAIRGSCQLTPRDRRNQQTMLIWLFIWMLAWVAANITIKEDMATSGVPAVAAVALPALLGVVVIFAYWKFIREADELQRKIHLDALALGFGIGVVGALTMHLLARLEVISAQDISTIGAVMMVAYSIGVLLGTRRFA